MFMKDRFRNFGLTRYVIQFFSSAHVLDETLC